MSGEQLLVGNGSVTHKQAADKATIEYRKYKTRTLSDVEQDYLDSIKYLEQRTDKNSSLKRSSVCPACRDHAWTDRHCYGLRQSDFFPAAPHDHQQKADQPRILSISRLLRPDGLPK